MSTCRKGEEVLVKTLNQNECRVMQRDGEKCRCLAGILKLVVAMDGIVKLERERKTFKNFAATRTSQVKNEVLRGMAADEALLELETYLDKVIAEWIS